MITTKTIARFLIIALVTTMLFTTISASVSDSADRAAAPIPIHSEYLTETRVPDAATATKEVFRSAYYVVTTVPNFGTPIRRAPIRRKGRVRH